MLGVFVAAMLYDTVGPVLLATPEPGQFQSIRQLKVSLLRPVRPGRLIGKGRIVDRDGDLVLLEAALIDAGEAVIATATGSGGEDRGKATMNPRNGISRWLRRLIAMPVAIMMLLTGVRRPNESIRTR